MSSGKRKSVDRVREVLNGLGLQLDVLELSDSTRTAQEAANAIGCSVSQIAKSLIFKGSKSQKPILIIASGTNRVDEEAVKKYTGEKLEKANADFVLEHTGFVIGGVPPIGHKNPIDTYIDEDLFRHEEIWAAAGTPKAVFKLTPEILVDITKGKIISVESSTL